jgi:quercetin dioxygenase-like cupin family protein
METRQPKQSGIQVLPLGQAQVLSQEWGALTWFANRELGNSSEVTVGRCLLHAGQSNPRHYHPNCSEVLVVLKGQIRHTINNGAETQLNEGDTVTVLPHVWHQATNIGEGEAILFIVFTSADRQTVGESP